MYLLYYGSSLFSRSSGQPGVEGGHGCRTPNIASSTDNLRAAALPCQALFFCPTLQMSCAAQCPNLIRPVNFSCTAHACRAARFTVVVGSVQRVQYLQAQRVSSVPPRTDGSRRWHRSCQMHSVHKHGRTTFDPTGKQRWDMCQGSLAHPATCTVCACGAQLSTLARCSCSPCSPSDRTPRQNSTQLLYRQPHSKAGAQLASVRGHRRCTSIERSLHGPASRAPRCQCPTRVSTSLPDSDKAHLNSQASVKPSCQFVALRTDGFHPTASNTAGWPLRHRPFAVNGSTKVFDRIMRMVFEYAPPNFCPDTPSRLSVLHQSLFEHRHVLGAAQISWRTYDEAQL